MKRLFLAILLSAGVIVGYGSAFWGDHDGPPCHRRDPPPDLEP